MCFAFMTQLAGADVGAVVDPLPTAGGLVQRMVDVVAWRQIAGAGRVVVGCDCGESAASDANAKRSVGVRARHGSSEGEVPRPVAPRRRTNRGYGLGGHHNVRLCMRSVCHTALTWRDRYPSF